MILSIRNGSLVVGSVVFSIAALIFAVYTRVEKKDKVIQSDTQDNAAMLNERMIPPSELQVKLRLANMEKRLLQLESEKLPQVERSTDLNVDEETKESQTEEQINNGPSSEEILGEWTSDFTSQDYDSNWAPVAENSLASELASIGGQAGFRLSQIQCRMDGCMAILEFENFEIAQKSATQLAVHIYPVNCGTRITMPTPEDRDSPYQARFFLTNCKKG